MANNKLITRYFRLNNAKQFVESIDEPANTIYYVFAAKPSQYTSGDNTIDLPSDSVKSLRTDIYDEMVFAKKVNASDVAIMADRHDWVYNTVYDMYDDTDSDLEYKNFFVVSKEGETYYVFKCLYNNGGVPSTSQPLYSATSSADFTYETSDGYIWKYLYKLDSYTFHKFATDLYIPVIPDANVVSVADSGSIDVIKIQSPGKQYNNYLSGSFIEDDLKYGGMPLKCRITDPDASLTPDFYRGCIIKIINGAGAGQYRTVTSYTVNEGYKFIYIDSAFSISSPWNIAYAQYEIMPAIKVYGDGRQTSNTIARGIVNSVSGNSIYKVDILDRGADYYKAFANVYAEPVVRISNTINDAVLRPIMSPRGGHGFDVQSELYSSHLGISVKFSNNENGTISTDNDYRTIGLIKDPKFFNIKLNYNDERGNGFIDTEKVVQIDLKRLGGGVQVSTTSKNVVGLGTFNSLTINSPGNTTYANTDVITISNVAVNAVCNLTTNSTGYIYSVALVSSGFGFADAISPVITIANAVGGNIRYVNSQVITGLTASANGRAYSNDEYVIISSTSSTVNAIANVSTNSIGGITSILITNSGKDFALNEIAGLNITANGLGYDSVGNNQIAFSGGGGTGAVATFTNTATGAISSVSLINPGTGYTSVPTATPIGSPSSPATIQVILQANGLSLKFANSTGGFSNGAKTANASVITGGDDGIYANSDYLIIPSTSSVHGNAVGNIVTTTTGSMSSINVNAGNNFGFTFDPATQPVPYVANSSGGKIRYFDLPIVSNIVVSNSAPFYKVSSVAITANGRGYDSTKILRVDVINGGIGYNSLANNVLIFSGGGGSGANATFTNNDSGSIISVTMVANGTGYTTLPTVFANASANGIGANLVPVFANSITFTGTNGGYGAIAYFTNNATGNIVSVSVANAGFNYRSAPTATISDPSGGLVQATFTVNIDGGANIFVTNDLVKVTNGTIDASANVVANATNYLTSLNLTSSGKGFNRSSLFVYCTNATSGNTRYFNNTVIKEVLIANGGYSGFCSNSDVLTISGGSINATANVVSNTVGGLQTINLTTSGLGFANHSALVMKLTNSIGGDIRYLNDYIVNSVSVSAGGQGFNNTNYLVVTCDGAAINATANIETSTAGVISSIQFTNRGKGIRPSYVSSININDGGSGYSNADKIVFCGGGGTGANAVLLTNSSGGIVRAFIVNAGINYDCAPSISIANSIGGTANGINANLSASIFKPSTIRIYDANNNPAKGVFEDISFTVSLSANAVANLVYAPTLGNSTSQVTVSNPAQILVNLQESSNLKFTSTLTPNISINLINQTTSFSSSLGAGDYIFLQTNDDQSQLLQVNSVTNSSHLVVTSFPAFSAKAVAISAANVHTVGNVLDQGVGYINVTNVTGFFTQSNVIYGLTSLTSGNVTGISFNNISKTGTTINQLFYYSVQSVTGTFQEDEIVYTNNIFNDYQSTAVFHSGNSSCIYVTSQNGIFYPGDTVVGKSSGATAVLSSGTSYKYEGDFIRGSGDVLYIENVDPISRSNSQSETIKLIVEF